MSREDREALLARRAAATASMASSGVSMPTYRVEHQDGSSTDHATLIEARRAARGRRGRVRVLR